MKQKRRGKRGGKEGGREREREREGGGTIVLTCVADPSTILSPPQS